ncbi:MAG: undecaprenyldiphospho-muramoylpentapeptide beta-N-acetylglucosaminyltransferase [Cyanobacteriota bacterium]|nr:undecaprenyldiphospho-muramoylpentapeptide beta-N-acetylglucosaminyltransferase [Cyanobacteriota bacterium]
MADGQGRLLMAASGTGGHVFPALAIADHLTDWSIEWLGVADRMESQLLAGRYPFHAIPMSGLQGSRWLAWPRTTGQLLRSVWQVRRLLQKGQFQGVLTTGGYIAAPAILAAYSLGIPVILHESNAIPGKVTRWLGRYCRVVALGMAAAAAHLPHLPTQVVGTPVRDQFWQPQPLADLGIPQEAVVIGVIGGSQGARGLNRIVVACAPDWLELGAWIVHLTGETDATALEKLAPPHPRYQRYPFRSDMPALLQRANFVVSRAGAATLAELAATATPAILIPYPYAAEDHQYHNAQAFVAAGGGVVFRESPQQVAAIRDYGCRWIGHPSEVALHRQALQQTPPQQATLAMVDLLKNVLKES